MAAGLDKHICESELVRGWLEVVCVNNTSHAHGTCTSSLGRFQDSFSTLSLPSDNPPQRAMLPKHL